MTTDANPVRALSPPGGSETPPAAVDWRGKGGPRAVPRVQKPRIGASTLANARKSLHLLDHGLRVDYRTRNGRAIQKTFRRLVTALGGQGVVSPQREELCRIVAVDLVLVKCVDAYIAALESPINRSRRRLHTIVEQRMRLADSVSKHLQTLGLERVAKDAGLSLRERLLKDQEEREAAGLAPGTEIVQQ